MDVVDNRSVKGTNAPVIDCEVVEDMEPDTHTPEDGEKPTPGPTLSFGTKAVLSDEDTRKIILERIKEHEEAVAVDECLLFEHRISGGDEHAVVARIAARYELVQAYVNEYNRIYGGSENG